MTDVRIISLDLDDTLWAVGPVIAAAEQALVQWLSTHCPRAMVDHDVESMRLLRAGMAARFPGHAHDLTFLRRQALHQQLTAAGYPAGPVDAALEVFMAARNRVTLFDDVLPALTRLRARYRVFALSNGNANLRRCGLDGLFDGHVTASAAGAAKPDARIFAQLVQLSGVAASAILHVGDDPLADAAGAARAGLAAVWLNRAAREWPVSLGPQPRTITTLSEIC